MRLAVLADIHANIFALDAVLEDMRQQGANNLVFLGDLVMIGPEPAAVFNSIRKLNPICWIKGNTDMWFEEITESWVPKTPREQEIFEYYIYAKTKLSQEAITFLTELPFKSSINYKGVSILCVHGSPRSVSEVMDYRTKDSFHMMVSEVKEDIILCGHSHIPFVGEAAGKRIFNVGSVGRPFDGDNRASYGILDLTMGKPQFIIRRVNYPLDETIRLAKNSGSPNLEKYEYSLVHATFV